MKVTMSDVANACGVSKSLVSRIINKDATLKIPESTRSRVLEEIDQLGYIPDYNARLLANRMQSGPDSGQTSIGCITFTSYNKLGHPYFSHIMQGVIDEVNENDCKLVTVLSFKELYEIFNLRKIENIPNMDGLIIFGWPDNPALQKILKQRARYVVCMDGVFDQDADFVGSDYNKSHLMALEHLYRIGYRDIGFIIGQKNESYQSCCSFLKGKDILPNEDWVLFGENNSDTAYEIVRRQLKEKKPPRAIAAWNDEMALGCMKALREQGVGVPQDVALIGHDDINMAAYAEIPLTTVRIHKEEIGRLAVRTLLDRVKSGRKIAIRVEMPGKLIVRDSCGVRLVPKSSAGS